MSFDMQAVEAEVQQAKTILAQAQSYVIDSQEMADAAAEDLQDIKSRVKSLNELRLSMTRPLDESKKRIISLFEVPLDALSKAEATHKAGLLEWQKQCDAKAEQARKEQEAEARKAAAEAAKAAEEAAQKAKAAEEAAKAALESGNEEQVAAAKEAMAAAITESQEMAMVADSIEYMAPVVAEKTKLTGISSRVSWKAEVTDLMALVKAVANGEASIDLLEANTKSINQRATALKAEFKVPGIRVYTVDIVSARAR